LQVLKKIILDHTRQFVLILYRDAKNKKNIFLEIYKPSPSIHFILAIKVNKANVPRCKNGFDIGQKWMDGLDSNDLEIIKNISFIFGISVQNQNKSSSVAKNKKYFLKTYKPSPYI
jgi:hypothetical protein